MDRRKPHTPSGTAATEFLLVAIPLLAMGLGAFDVSRWHLARQAVSHALLEAARAGSVHHGNPQAIQEALQRALAPLQGARAAHTLQTRYGLPAWRIEVLGPTARHFDDFPGPPVKGMRSIRHSYQHEQHLRAMARGSPQGRGAASGETIFQANTLVLRITYLHTPLVPGMRSLARLAGRLAGGESATAAAMRTAGVIPVRQSISVTMQSAPFEWAAGNSPALLAPPHVNDLPSGKPATGAGAFPQAACSSGGCAPTAPATAGDTQARAPGQVSDQTSVMAADDDLAQACAAALCCPPGSG